MAFRKAVQRLATSTENLDREALTEFFGGHVYRALQAHQATAANSPPYAAFWQLVL